MWRWLERLLTGDYPAAIHEGSTLEKCEDGTERLLWTGDGDGHEQKGRRVRYGGRLGTVTGGTILTVVVRWDK